MIRLAATAVIVTVLAAAPQPISSQSNQASSDYRALLKGYLREAQPGTKVGVLSTNPYLPGSTSSVGSRYAPNSPANPYGQYGSPYSVNGASNPYTTGGLDIIGSDGAYLGKLNSNRYDPNSVANPYGRYGSPYSSESINNPYGRFGSPFSSTSPANPYAASPPGLYAPSSYQSSSASVRTTLPPLPSWTPYSTRRRP